jgi:hypothetical protein
MASFQAPQEPSIVAGLAAPAADGLLVFFTLDDLSVTWTFFREIRILPYFIIEIGQCRLS